MIKEVKSGFYNKTMNGSISENGFNFYTDLSAKDKMKFVNGATELIVGNNYNSIIKDLIFDFEIINIFTDVDISEMNDVSDSISYIEDLVENTNIVDIVIKNVKEGLIDSLREAVDDNIEFKTGIRKNTLSSALSHLINTLEKKLDGVNIEEMMAFVNAINEIPLTNNLTSEEILNAYIKSDIFKNNQKEIASAREKHIKELEEINSDK